MTDKVIQILKQLKSSGDIVDYKYSNESETSLIINLPKRDAASRTIDLFHEQPKEDTVMADIRKIFDYWKMHWAKHNKSKNPPKLLDSRIRMLKTRLIKEKWLVGELMLAIEAIWSSQWHLENGQVNFELLFRSGSQVERFLARRPESAKIEKPAEVIRLQPHSKVELNKNELQRLHEEFLNQIGK